MGRLASIAVLACLGVGIAGCGSGGNDNPGPDTAEKFTNGFAAQRATLNDVPIEVGKLLGEARGKSDAVIAGEVRFLQGRFSKQMDALNALVPTRGSTPYFYALTQAGHIVDLDLIELANAAAKHDIVTARAATQKLTTDAKAMQGATKQLATDLGLAKTN